MWLQRGAGGANAAVGQSMELPPNEKPRVHTERPSPGERSGDVLQDPDLQDGEEREDSPREDSPREDSPREGAGGAVVLDPAVQTQRCQVEEHCGGRGLRGQGTAGAGDSVREKTEI